MRLFIFGSTGDLVKRKILPALHHIPKLEVYAIGRKNISREEYHKGYCPECEIQFTNRLHYINVDFDNLYEEIKNYIKEKEENYFYLSLPPDMILKVLKELVKVENNTNIRILIEKPFGSSLKEAKKLKKFIYREKLEENIFLADHYLFKDNIPQIKNFSRIKIVSLEKVGLENRGYYDSIGALKDMIQSHLLNLLLKITRINIKEIIIKSAEFKQYKEYEQELGMKSSTETFVKLELDYKGKKIELITGKAFDKKLGFIEIDGERYNLGEENSYIKLFQSFFNNKKKEFPTIEQALETWKLSEKIIAKKKEVDYYPKNSLAENFL